MILSLDFETRSTVNLPRTGVHRYAEDPTTDLWCMAWAIDDEEPQLWLPGQLVPLAFLGAVINERAELRAWNAQFERVIWEHIAGPRYGFPEVPLERWHDTAAEAAAMALPRALGNAAAACGVEHQKDDAGHRLMMQMSRPRSNKKGRIVWWNVPEKIQRLGEYCVNDVRVERSMARVLRRLTIKEREVYLLDQRMNDRGVLIDVPLVHAAKRITQESTQRANEEIRNITGAQVTNVTQVAEIKMWLATEGVYTDSIRKSLVQEMLGEDFISDDARTVLSLRAEAGKSSVAKLDAMLRVICEDMRARGLLLYHGANTGRWAGRLIQVHNFPRGSIDNVEDFIEDILGGRYDFLNTLYPPIQIVSSLLRGMLRASPGKRFLIGDFAQIEARVLAWLAGQEDMVQLFASGGKVYHQMAADVYGVPVSEIIKGAPEYQLGKAAVLGCGYQMGGKTFKKQAKEMWGLEISEELANHTVQAYRSRNLKIIDLWGCLNYAAMEAIRHPGKKYTVNRCIFTKRGGYLWLILPSGRPLAYPSPTIEKRMTPWKEMRDSAMAYSVNSVTRAWQQRALYGGLLTENIVQALARDLMMEALLRVEARGYEPLFSVHDEVVSEVKEGVGSVEEFEEIMSAMPTWAEGLPMAVEAFEAERYRK